MGQSKKEVLLILIQFQIEKRSQRRKENERPILNPQFNETEDQLLLKLVLLEGPKFKKISKQFPTKNFHSVKNRYYKYTRYNQNKLLGIPEPNEVESTQQKIMDPQLKLVLDDNNLFDETKTILEQFLTSFSQSIQKMVQTLNHGV